jgi:hypothetical protein
MVERSEETEAALDALLGSIDSSFKLDTEEGSGARSKMLDGAEDFASSIVDLAATLALHRGSSVINKDDMVLAMTQLDIPVPVGCSGATWGVVASAAEPHGKKLSAPPGHPKKVQDTD